VGFNLQGAAAGPYPGAFVETGSFSLSGNRNPPWAIRFSAAFTIRSGTTTITGSFVSPKYAWWGIGFICTPSGGVSGYSAGGPVTYTSVINGQTYQGTGSVSGTFYETAGAKDSVGESVIVTYGQISGTVTDSDIHGPIAGICVEAYNSTGGVVASAQTNASGVYTLSPVLAGSDRVGFSSGCGAGNYVTQYYNRQASLAASIARERRPASISS
jgi:hypothetical protein